MNQTTPTFLVEYLREKHSELVELGFGGLEQLTNMKYPSILDSGLWFDSKHYLTVITTELDKNNPLESTFSLAIGGRIFRSQIKGGKYKSHLSIEDLDQLLNQALMIVKESTFDRSL